MCCSCWGFVIQGGIFWCINWWSLWGYNWFFRGLRITRESGSLTICGPHINRGTWHLERRPRSRTFKSLTFLRTPFFLPVGLLTCWTHDSGHKTSCFASPSIVLCLPFFSLLPAQCKLLSFLQPLALFRTNANLVRLSSFELWRFFSWTHGICGKFSLSYYVSYYFALPLVYSTVPPRHSQMLTRELRLVPIYFCASQLQDILWPTDTRVMFCFCN